MSKNNFLTRPAIAAQWCSTRSLILRSRVQIQLSLRTNGLYYKHVMIVNDDSSVISKWSTKLIDNTWVINYDCNMFYKTGQRKKWKIKRSWSNENIFEIINFQIEKKKIFDLKNCFFLVSCRETVMSKARSDIGIFWFQNHYSPSRWKLTPLILSNSLKGAATSILMTFILLE